MQTRTLLIAILTALVAAVVVAGSPAPARADAGTASAAACSAAGATATSDAACASSDSASASDQQTATTPTDTTTPPAGQSAPAAPAGEQTTPATPAPDQSAPAGQPAPTVDTSATPQTDAPSSGTQEPQPVEQEKAKPKSQVEGKTKTRKPRKRRTSPDSGHVGPDDSSPPPPPSSLLKGGSTTTAPQSTGAVGGSGTLPFTGAPIATAHSVPNIVLDRFSVPPFLLPIYQAAGMEYGVSWEVLAAINAIETDYGRNLSVSTAGAEGWMQFMPGTWRTYGVDANRDGRKDPYNPVDAIFTAARYLKAAGAGQSLQKAIFSYNHAQWYVDDVLARARALSTIPAEVIDSLSGLTLGRFPIAAFSTYAGRLDTSTRHRVRAGNAALTIGSSATRRGMRIYARPGSPVVAVQDSTVVSVGESRRLGRYVRLRDAYGNTYTYAHLAKVARLLPVPRPRTESEREIRRELGLDGKDPKPTSPATAGRQTTSTSAKATTQTLSAAPLAQTPPTSAANATGVAAPVFTTQHPGGTAAPLTGDAPATTVAATDAPAATAGAAVSAPAVSIPATTTTSAALMRGLATTPDATLDAAADSGGRPPLYIRLRAYAKLAMAQIAAAAPKLDTSTYKAYFTSKPLGLKQGDYVLRPLRPGAKVIAGTIIGRVGMASLRRTAGSGAGDRAAARKAAAKLHVARVPHLYFEIRPAGRNSPRIDPKPILDGWRLLDETAIYRARNPLVHTASVSDRLTTGQILLMSKDQLARHVLANPHIKIYDCGRQDIEAGAIDRRVLATLEFLVSRGMDPTVTALKCGHSLYTTSGNISEHSTGDAVDIAAINGTPIAGHQGPGSLTDKVVRQLLTLQGAMKPHQIITLMQYPGTDNTLALPDHWDHIHVGFHESVSDTSALKPSQWDRLINGLEQIRNPTIIDAGQVAAARRRASAARSTSGGPTPPQVTAAVDAADLIADFPYIWGGGHESFAAPGYDCSGSVSYVLHGAGLLNQPLTSGDLESYGAPGPGRWITIYANAVHTFMVIGGWRYDTGNLPSYGTRWSDTGRSTAGFVVRHPPGL